jgi:hypothetical protein
MFSVFRVLYKFDFRPVIHKTQVNIGKKGIVIETHVSDKICMFSPRPSLPAPSRPTALCVNRQYMHHLLQQQILVVCPHSVCGPGSSVRIANRYGLDGPRIESR